SQAKAAARSGGDEESVANASQLLALIATHEGSFEDAEALLNEAGRFQGGGSHSRASVLTKEYLGDLALERGDFNRAAALYQQAFAEAISQAPRGDLVAELHRR